MINTDGDVDVGDDEDVEVDVDGVVIILRKWWI